jgi:GT2 family glycosyltransferase
MNRRVYILLPVYNRRDITAGFIECLKHQTYPNVHLILIDDGSTDGTENMVREGVEAGRLTVVRGKGNWWWAGSLQQGIKRLKRIPPAPSDIILMINDDVMFENDFIENGVGEVMQHPDSLLLANCIDGPEGEIVETGLKVDFRKMSFSRATSAEAITCLSTRGLFMRWAVLERIGGFYPLLLPHYGSDFEFTMRARRKGFELRTCDNVCLTADLAATGVRNIAEGSGFTDVLKQLFDKKSAMNPVYRTTFIILTCPPKWIPAHIIKTWLRAGRHILKSFREGRRK